MFLASVCVFVTTYNMILPAISVEKGKADSVSGLYLEDAEKIDENQYTRIDPALDDVVTDAPVVQMQEAPNEALEQASEVIELYASGDTYEIFVTYGDETGIPENAHLEVQEITKDSEVSASGEVAQYDEYIDNTLDALGWENGRIPYARIFDICITDELGEKIQPTEGTKVGVRIELSDNECENLNVVHFDESDEGNVLKSSVEAADEGQVIEFETDVLSVDAIVGTVIEKNVLASDGKNYKVTVTYGADTGIPDTADLNVEEILPDENGDASTSSVYGKSYEEYVAYTENALGMQEGSAGYIRLFDIKIVDKNDHSVKYQPKEGTIVDVRVELADKDSSEEAAASTRVVHFEDNSEFGDKIDSITEGQVVSFGASGFSIYAIVDDTKIITVNFYDGDGNFISSEYVKKNGDEIEDLYSPGFELEYGESFYGWATSQDAVSGIDIDALNASFKANWNSYSEDTPVNYYAVVKKVYVVTFNKYDDEGNLAVLRTVTIPVDQANKTIVIPGDLGAEVGNDFQGWLGQDGTLYTEGQSFTVNDHYTFFMKEQGRYWLVFDSNAGGPGSGATYTPPQLIYGEGVVTEQPGNPTRTGYSFLGWNTSPDGTGTWWYKTDGSVTNRFGGTISSDTTLYAQWEGDLTKYYVLYWQQDVGDDAGLSDDQKNYNYVGSREGTARTGDTVSTTQSDRNKDGTTGYEQYHYNNRKSQTTKTVAADGTTTINVYYDLNDYTLKFQVTGNYHYEYTETTSNTGTQFGYYNGGYVQLYYNNGIWYRTRTGGGWGGYNYSNPYNGTRYTRDYTNLQTIKTINALYGHNISDQFPIVGTNGVTYDHGERWMPQNDPIWKEVMVYIETMPSRNVTFRLNTSNANTKTMNYRVQALPGTASTTTWNNQQFILYNSINANYGGVTIEDYIELQGFTKYGVDPSYTYNNGNFTYYVGSQNSSTAATTVDFYYLRNQYDIHYISVNDGRLEYDEKDIYYQQSLSDFGPDGSHFYVPTNGVDGYAFVGWYTNESCAPGTEFDFNTTMPAKDITLYAKWEEQRCRVVLDPNAPTGEYSFANNQALSFRLDYNDKVDGTNITGSAVNRPGYKLDGWYTEDGNLWNFDTQVNESVAGVNSEYQSTEDWTNNVYGDNDGKHNNVKNILKLKAKWKLDIADNSVYVIYKVNDVYYTYNASGDLQTAIPVDDTAYVLQEGATDVSFRTQPAPTGYNDGYVFRDWALLTSSGEKSGTTFMDGSQATVDEEYFVIETIVDDDGNVGTLRYVVLEAQFDPNENRATAVVYNGNGGTTETGSTTIGESYLVNKTFNILGEDAFNREGYSFVEWNTKADGTGTSLEAGAEVAADNLDGTAWDSVGRTNNLYAIWEINTYTVIVKKVVDGVAEGKRFSFAATTTSEDFTIPEGDAIFLLTDGGDKQFSEVPYGTVLTFSETPASGYSIQSVIAKQTSLPDKTVLEEAEYIDLGGADGKAYTIKGDTIITYTNEKAKEQKLRIYKIGDDASDGLAGATFSLTSSDAEGFTNKTGLVSMDNTTPGNLGYLPSGEADNTVFTLPVGTYTLTETNAPQYYDGISGAVILSVTGDGISITGIGNELEALFEGVDISEVDGVYTLTITNTRKKATVTIIKNVTGTEVDKNAQYSFIATGLAIEEDAFSLYGQHKDASSTAPEQKNTKVYDDIPHGTVFSITETADTDFITTITATYVDSEGVTQAITLDSERANSLSTGDITVNGDMTITYTNTRNKQPVAIYKTGIGDNETITTGATFVLYKANEYDDEKQEPKEGATIITQGTTNGNGILILGELPIDEDENCTEYRLVETSASAGYILPEEAMKIFVYPNRVYGMQATGNMAVKDANDYSDIIDKTTTVLRVWNNPGVSLPNTGGPGTNVIYLLGTILTALAGAGLVLRKRRRA